MNRGALAGLLTAVGLAGACSDSHGPAEAAPQAVVQPPAPSEPAPVPNPPASDEAPKLVEATPRPPAPSQAEPADPPVADPTFRVARAGLRVFSEPSFDAPFRGQIPRDEVFAVTREDVDGDEECRTSWAELSTAAYACLDRTEATDRRPRAVPVIPDGKLLPFVYFRRSKREPEGTPDPGIWRSLAALRRGDDPIDHVHKHRDYAFVRRRRGRGGPFLINRNRHTVREKDVERLEPSDFAGRELVDDPIPDGVLLGWSVHWPNSTLYAEPKADAEVVGAIAFHETAYLTGRTQRHRRQVFWEVAGEPGGWVDAKQAKRYEPFEAPPQLDGEEHWIDIDLSQQTLAVVEGDTPVFVTLISSGSWKNPTPTGLFRLLSKHGLDDMRSRPSEEDPYTVEGVPWAQYFDGRYGLHGTYWHNRFGMRTSHGCVNLSAKDAARVFAATSPTVPGGWMTMYEHAEDLGTVIRIRKGPEHPEDRRGAVAERRRSDYR